MKRLILAAAMAGALTACGDVAEEADEPEAVATAETAPEAAAASSAGTYEVTTPDGMTFISVLDPDGTYEDRDAEGAVTESGTWEDRPDGKTCFDTTDGDDSVICFTVGEAAADGSQVATPDNGDEPLTIKKTA